MKRVILFACLLFSLSFKESEGASALRGVWHWLSTSPCDLINAQARKVSSDLGIDADTINSPKSTMRSVVDGVLPIVDKGVAVAIGAFAGQIFADFITSGGGGVIAGIATGAVVTVAVLYDPVAEALVRRFGGIFKGSAKEIAMQSTALVVGAGSAAPLIWPIVSILANKFVPAGQCLEDFPYARGSATALAIYGVVNIGIVTSDLFIYLTDDEKRGSFLKFWGYAHTPAYQREALDPENFQRKSALSPQSLLLRFLGSCVSLSGLKPFDMITRNSALEYYYNCPKGIPTPATPLEWVAFQEKASDFVSGAFIPGVVPVLVLATAGWYYGGYIDHCMQTRALSSLLAFISGNFVGIFSGVVLADVMRDSVFPNQSLLVSMDVARQGLGVLLDTVNGLTVQYPDGTFSIFKSVVTDQSSAVLGPLRVGSGLMLPGHSTLLEAPAAIITIMGVSVLLMPGLERFFNSFAYLHNPKVTRADVLNTLIGDKPSRLRASAPASAAASPGATLTINPIYVQQKGGDANQAHWG